jgi:hypothetical protein
VKLGIAAAIVMLALAPAATLAQSLDSASAEALAATLRLLQDPTARSAAIAGNPQASTVDAQLQALAGSNMQELYALAAAIFSELAANSGGDVGKMSQALSRATNDPAGFAATLSPATLQRLGELSVKISDRPR